MLGLLVIGPGYYKVIDVVIVDLWTVVYCRVRYIELIVVDVASHIVNDIRDYLAILLCHGGGGNLLYDFFGWRAFFLIFRLRLLFFVVINFLRTWSAFFLGIRSILLRVDYLTDIL